MNATTYAAIDNTVRCLEDARRALRALYLSDPDDDMLAADTPVPPQYQALADALHAAHGNALNARDFYGE